MLQMEIGAHTRDKWVSFYNEQTPTDTDGDPDTRVNGTDRRVVDAYDLIQNPNLFRTMDQQALVKAESDFVNEVQAHE